MSTPALAATGMSVSYGGVRALAEVDVEVRGGDVVGLIGPNGAGKTTFIDAVTGFTAARGVVTLDGRDLSRLAPHRRARRGLSRTWQAGELFDDLTVAENLAVTAGAGTLWQLARRGRRSGAAAERVLGTLGLADLTDALPEQLSQGQRKLVGVARALVGEPSVVLLDEPAAGLDTEESRELGRHLRAVARSGPGMLLVDHDMGLVLSVCDLVVVMDFGRVIARGTPDEIRRDPAVIAAYIGEDAAGGVPVLETDPA